MNDKVMKSRRYYAILLVLLVAVSAMFFKCERKHYFNQSGVVWTTEYHITYEANRSLNDSIQRILQAIDASVSPYNQSSLISALNVNKSQEADDYFVMLYHASQQVHRQSGGAFDPTVMPLVNAWGFGYKNGTPPTHRQVDSILTFVGLDKTRLDGRRLHKDDDRIQFDFSSIAKGMACDEIGRMLERNGARNYVVEIGGEVMARGVNNRGQRWHVSVDMPIEQADTVSHESALLLAIDSGAVATSGSYRKFHEVDGRRVTHIIDPATGSSESSDLLSVTVTAPSCMLADAWATACMVMGPQATQRLMESRSDLGVMTISAGIDGTLTVWSNRCFADLIVP